MNKVLIKCYRFLLETEYWNYILEEIYIYIFEMRENKGHTPHQILNNAVVDA